MANIIRSYYDAYGLDSLTEKINLVPNVWDTINQLGIFPSTVEGTITDSVAVDLIETNSPIIKDMVRGVRNQYGRDDKRSKKTWGIPHYNLDDVVTAKDVKGRTAYGKEITPETVAEAVMRKMASIRRGWAQLRETQRAQILTDGTAYCPNGTMSLNYYTEFSVTRKEIDMVWGTSTSDIKGKVTEGVNHIYDNALTGLDPITGFVALCNPTFFANLVNHPKLIAAYNQYASIPEPLRNRLSSNLPMGTQTFDWNGVLFVEYRGKLVDGTALIPAGEARLIPTGAFDMFRSFAAPSEKLSDVNTMGQEMYMYQYLDPHDEGILIQSESNVLNAVVRPQCIVRLYSST